MADVAIPDAGNYELGDEPIPDNLLDDTLHKAVTQHSRKESRIASVEEDFSQHLDKKVASNLANKLIGFIGDKTNIDPDEDESRQNNDDDIDDENKPSIDEVLIEAVHSHKHRKSRTDFVEKKLHELFPQTDDRNELVESYTSGGDTEKPQTSLTASVGMSGGYGAGAMDMSLIASNLVSFLHDDPAKSSTVSSPTQPSMQPISESGAPQKARGSTDLSILQKEIESLKSRVNRLESDLDSKNEENSELTNRVEELEKQNDKLIKEIQFLQNGKTKLAMSANTTINELRSYLLKYQNLLNGHIK